MQSIPRQAVRCEVRDAAQVWTIAGKVRKRQFLLLEIRSSLTFSAGVIFAGCGLANLFVVNILPEVPARVHAVRTTGHSTKTACFRQICKGV